MVGVAKKNIKARLKKSAKSASINKKPSTRISIATNRTTVPGNKTKEFKKYIDEQDLKSLSAYKIIAKKRDGQELNKEEINWFIQNYLKNEIQDYQMSALLMAMYLKGLSKNETSVLTENMLYSGKTLSFSQNQEKYIDKHSTGGIGDKTSLIITPIAAAAGVKVPMIAGRGLGFTGGTIDKLESIPGFKTSFEISELYQLINNAGCFLSSQTEEIAPADKKIYALRDVTATIDSIPLITASIMSKKLAEGTKGLVLDVKFGEGAFMKTPESAELLAKSLMNTAHQFKVHSFCFLTDMSQPLGMAVGNSIEVIESIETLKGRGPRDLTDLSLELAGAMIYLAQLAPTLRKGILTAKEILVSGRALNKFRELIISQKGNPEVIDNYNLLPMAKNKIEVFSERVGFVHHFENQEVGFFLIQLNGGRKTSKDKIDHGVGFLFHKKIGDQVKKNEKIATIFFNPGQEKIANHIKENFIQKTILISKQRPKLRPLVHNRFIKWCEKE